MGKVIVVSGTPGVGKSLVARKLAEEIRGFYVNLSDLVLKEKLYISRDVERDTIVIDEEKVREEIEKLTEKHELIVLDSHYGEIVPSSILEAIIVLRLNPGVLWRRLEERGWSRKKIVENVESELVGVCTYNALKSHSPDKIVEVDVTDKSIDEVLREILERLESKELRGPRVDWTLKLHSKELLELLREASKS